MYNLLLMCVGVREVIVDGTSNMHGLPPDLEVEGLEI
jgi:hypothetical protein